MENFTVHNEDVPRRFEDANFAVRIFLFATSHQAPSPPKKCQDLIDASHIIPEPRYPENHAAMSVLGSWKFCASRGGVEAFFGERVTS